MNNEMKKLLDSLSIDDLKDYLQQRQGIYYVDIKLTEDLISDLNRYYDVEVELTQSEWADLFDKPNFDSYCNDFWIDYTQSKETFLPALNNPADVVYENVFQQYFDSLEVGNILSRNTKINKILK